MSLFILKAAYPSSSLAITNARGTRPSEADEGLA